jgi:hypothetical protein
MIAKDALVTMFPPNNAHLCTTVLFATRWLVFFVKAIFAAFSIRHAERTTGYMQPPLRYPAHGQMSSFANLHSAKAVVLENVLLMRGFQAIWAAIHRSRAIRTKRMEFSAR